MSSLTLIQGTAGTAVEPQKDPVLSGFSGRELTVFPCWWALSHVYEAQRSCITWDAACVAMGTTYPYWHLYANLMAKLQDPG